MNCPSISDRAYTALLLLVSLAVALVTQQWPPALVAIFAMLNYMHERFELGKLNKVTTQDLRIEELSNTIFAAIARFEKLEAMNDDVRKQSEDVKKIVTQYNLKQAFGPKV